MADQLVKSLIPYGYNNYLDAIFPRWPNGSLEDIAFRQHDGMLQAYHDGTWIDIVSMSDLKGSPGDPGSPGSAGTSAEQPQLGVMGGWICWRRGNENWQQLVALSDLQGSPGLDGSRGDDGFNATDDQVAAKVQAYLTANPPKSGTNGKDGTNGTNGSNATDAQVQAAVNAYIAAHPPANGKDGKDGINGTNGTNATANILVGQVTIGQSATIAIVLGERQISVACNGTVPGERYLCFVRSYKLNGGASTPGRPVDYWIIDCACNASNQITVTLRAPALALNSSYALLCDIVKIGV